MYICLTIQSNSTPATYNVSFYTNIPIGIYAIHFASNISSHLHAKHIISIII